MHLETRLRIGGFELVQGPYDLFLPGDPLAFWLTPDTMPSLAHCIAYGGAYDWVKGNGTMKGLD